MAGQFELREDASDCPILREIKEGHINLACQILNCCEVAQDEWFIFVWDGTDTRSNAVRSKLEDEMSCPLPLQPEPFPLMRVTLPTVGSILRITFDIGIDKNYLHLLPIGKWIKFVNMCLEVHAGLWCGVFTPFTKLQYTPNDVCLIVECQRLYDERMISLELGRMPSSILPLSSCITEVNYDHMPFVTLMDVLTHSEETLFDDHPDIDSLIWKLNRLLGVTMCDDSRGEKILQEIHHGCLCVLNHTTLLNVISEAVDTFEYLTPK